MSDEGVRVSAEVLENISEHGKAVAEALVLDTNDAIALAVRILMIVGSTLIPYTDHPQTKEQVDAVALAAMVLAQTYITEDE